MLPPATILPAVKLPLDMLPVTTNELKIPTLVIFGCAAVVNVPPNNDALTVPELA